MTRGAVAGSGAFKGLGRSIAFASGGFIAFHSAGEFLRDSINAAREAAVAHRALAAQMKASGESFDANRERIEKVSRSYAKFGFENDEVVKSLTVLERGTGNLDQALKLQLFTADLARAKSIDLAAAANTVAKVFGGQETALRRAVPGLEKNAHGLDLIREAQKKMAGQAAANTTASEQFAATLHDTKEIIGTALLPTLNKYLTSLGKWLQRMNESGELEKKVTAVTGALASAVGIVRGAFDKLNDITGSTKNSLKLLFGVLVAYKSLQLVSKLSAVATSIGLIGTRAQTSTGQVKGLRLAFVGRLGLAAGVVTAGYELSTFIRQIPGWDSAFKSFGATVFDVGEKLGAFSPGASIKDVLRMQEAQRLPGLRGPTAKAAPSLPPGLQGALTPSSAAVTAAKRTAEQLNQFFDAMIGRRLGRVQDAPLRAQLGLLNRIGALITKRIAATKDVTRKLNLEDQLLEISRQKKDVRAELAQGFIDGLQFNVDKAGLTATMADDIAALNALLAGIRKRMQLEGATLDLRQQELGVQQQLAAIAAQQAAQQAAQAKAARDAAKALREQQAQTRMDWAQLALEKAQATKGLGDDIKALKRIIALIKQQIRLTGLTVDLARQLFEAQQQLKDVRSQGRKKSPGGGGGGGGAWSPASTTGTELTLPLRRLPPFQPPTRRPSTGPSSGFGGVTINGGVNLYGVQNVSEMEHQLQKRAMARPQTRRGPV